MSTGNYVQENLAGHNLLVREAKAMRRRQRFVCWSCGSEKHADDGVVSRPEGFGTRLIKFVCHVCKETAAAKKLTKEKANERTDTTQED